MDGRGIEMVVVSKKNPCPICGGLEFLVLPLKIEGIYICDPCRDKIDMELFLLNNLTIAKLKEYMNFYDKNQLLKQKFSISEQIDFGMWNTKISFDFTNQLFCMDKKPKTVFEGNHLRFFTIKEDNSILFEGSVDGIQRYTSNVLEKITSVSSEIEQIRLNNQIIEMKNKLLVSNKHRKTVLNLNKIREPFQEFIIELIVEHPYWTIIKIEMDGPRFDSYFPSVSDYIVSYQSNIKLIEKLVNALNIVAFPAKCQQSIGMETMCGQPIRTINYSKNDFIEEVNKNLDKK